MAKYDEAAFAAINGKAYRDYLHRHPDAKTVTLTRGQLEAICRDLIDYTDRDADARGWAEQATKNAAEINRLRGALEKIGNEAVLRDEQTIRWMADDALAGSVEETHLVAIGMAAVQRVIARLDEAEQPR